jgi:hypothetical protein
VRALADLPGFVVFDRVRADGKLHEVDHAAKIAGGVASAS